METLRVVCVSHPYCEIAKAFYGKLEDYLHEIFGPDGIELLVTNTVTEHEERVAGAKALGKPYSLLVTWNSADSLKVNEGIPTICLTRHHEPDITYTELFKGLQNLVRLLLIEKQSKDTGPKDALPAILPRP